MTCLMEIQEITQQVEEAISTALKVETEIVGETITVVAGTGKLKKRINTKEEGGQRKRDMCMGVRFNDVRLRMGFRWILLLSLYYEVVSTRTAI
ncbi:hypothetical protein [Fictibacillus gelatini]|uniref:hypothetical protein n=1 Tax=Fictibacillus gelatini TaxID=225985 RepID=UPI000479FDFF|nr:hypothetical protein [Fictibacillus gelatini]